MTPRSAARNSFYGWPGEEKFLVPDGVREHFAQGAGQRGQHFREQWDKLFARYSAEYPELAAQLDNMQRRRLPAGWDADLPVFPPTRRVSLAATPAAKC